MHILLPPSETKRSGGVLATAAPALPHDEVLSATRASIRSALDELMLDHDEAAKALKLGARSRDELIHNVQLDDAGLLPAVERYTGVLYDALAVETLDAVAREWISDYVSIQSALFGLVQAQSLIPAYRLSGSTRLPSLTTPLKRVWAAAHADIDWEAFGWVLDLRSKDYVALAPIPFGRGAFAEIMLRDAAGGVRSLNHFNKASKGKLVRMLAQSRPTILSAHDLVVWAAGNGIEAELSADEKAIKLIFAESMHG